MYPDLSGTNGSEDRLMAKKQSDYLADLLAEEAAEASQKPAEHDSVPSPAPTANRAGMSLLGRESALARVASGEVKQVTQLQLEPERVRIWEGNARLQARLNEANVRDLIDSILSEGGQKVPVVVRRVSDDPAYDYEVIAGTRRQFAISWLRRNSYPEMRLLAQVADLDDEAAFRLADIENRARKDVTEIERARNYALALKEHYGGKQVRMAERLRLSKGWLSKMIKAGSIPDEVLAAFPDLSALTLNPAYALASVMDDPERAKTIRYVAGRIGEKNATAKEDGRPPLPHAEVYHWLMTAGIVEPDPPVMYEGRSRYGRPTVAVTAANRQGITLRVHAASGSNEEELVADFREALRHHMPKAAGE
jgi:ParB family transcriptional regulator, chromosome partitioning protein